MKANIVAQRLKKLRKKAGYTQEELAIELYKKQNVSITTATIKKYETSNPNKLNQICGMRIEFLNAFADFYGVPTDYILGRTRSTSVSLTEQDIYETLGLSEKAIRQLKHLCNNRDLTPKLFNQDYTEDEPIFVIDSLLSNIDFMSDFPSYLLKYCFKKAKGEIKDLEKAEQRFNSSDIFKNKSREALQKHLALVSSEFNRKFKDVNRYYAICLIEDFINDFYKRFLRVYKMDKFKQSQEGQMIYKEMEKEFKEVSENKKKEREARKINGKKNK